MSRYAEISYPNLLIVIQPKLQTPNSKLQTPNSKLQTPNTKRYKYLNAIEA